MVQSQMLQALNHCKTQQYSFNAACQAHPEDRSFEQCHSAHRSCMNGFPDGCAPLPLAWACPLRRAPKSSRGTSCKPPVTSWTDTPPAALEGPALIAVLPTAPDVLCEAANTAISALALQPHADLVLPESHVTWLLAKSSGQRSLQGQPRRPSSQIGANRQTLRAESLTTAPLRAGVDKRTAAERRAPGRWSTAHAAQLSPAPGKGPG
jgi:hypothetical protein